MKIKIVTYNIHMWMDGDGNNNVSEVVETLAAIAPDVIALQEVYHFDTPLSSFAKATKKLAKRGYPYWAFAPTDARSVFGFGNAVISRFPIVAHHKLILKAKQSEERVCLLTKIQLPESGSESSDSASPPRYLNFFTTHLDHMREPYRIAQFQDILDFLKAQQEQGDNSPFGGPHLLVGDFNALRRDDYDEGRWEEIRSLREKNSWEAPQTGLLSKILNEEGYIDCWVECGRVGPLETCWANTRIDFMFASKGFFYNNNSNNNEQTSINTTSASNCNNSVNETNSNNASFCTGSTTTEILAVEAGPTRVETSPPPPPPPQPAAEKRRLISCQRFESDASDHYPVVLEVDI